MKLYVYMNVVIGVIVALFSDEKMPGISDRKNVDVRI